MGERKSRERILLWKMTIIIKPPDKEVTNAIKGLKNNKKVEEIEIMADMSKGRRTTTKNNLTSYKKIWKCVKNDQYLLYVQYIKRR